VCKTEQRYLFTVSGQSSKCPMRFEYVDVYSPDWLVGVLARVNSWMPGQRRQQRHFECRVRRVRTWTERSEAARWRSGRLRHINDGTNAP